MSVMTNSTVQACHQKVMGSKTMEKRVSTVILNVYQSTGTEKEDDSRLSLENHGVVARGVANHPETYQRLEN